MLCTTAIVLRGEGSGVWEDLVYRGWGLGFRVSGLGFRVKCLVFSVQGFEFRV